MPSFLLIIATLGAAFGAAFNLSVAFAVTPVSAPVSISFGYSRFGCISDATASKFISDLGIQINTFSGGKELCDNTKEAKKLFDLLTILGEARFNPKIRSRLDQSVVTTDYLSYFKKRVSSIVRDDEDAAAVEAEKRKGFITTALLGFSVPGEAKLRTDGVAYVIPPDAPMTPGVMHIKSLFDDRYITIESAVSTLIHEARHDDAFIHVTCRHSKGNIEGGCDDKFSDGGAYGTEAEFQARVAVNGVNFHPVFKTMARIDSLFGLKYNFNRPTPGVEGNRNVLVLVDKSSGSLLLVDRGKVFQRSEVRVGGAKLTSMALGYNIGALPPEHNKTVYGVDIASKDPIMDYSKVPIVSERMLSPSVLWMSRHFGPNEWLRFIDYMDIGQDDAWVSLRVELVQFRSNTKNNTAYLPQDGSTAVRLLTVLPHGKRGLFVLFDNNRILDISSMRTAASSAELKIEFVTDVMPPDLVTIYGYGPGLIGLEKSGRVVEISLVDGSRKPYAPLAGMSFSDMRVLPMANALDLEL